MIEALIQRAHAAGASDLHLEPGLPAAVRVDGRLQRSGSPITAQQTRELARRLIPDSEWPRFLERRSYDLSQRIAGVACRINLLQSLRGVGLAVRLLSGGQPSLARLNLHPDLEGLVAVRHGLVLVVGTTGSGKSSTLAALIQELDRPPARHVLTLEEPVEYRLRTQHAFVRQREVGRHTPSFEQGLLDAMREDPDVILVGEMRRARTMQLTLDAAETGHLVLASMHAGSVSEALQRLISSFPPESQAGVRVQLASSLVGVVAQRLVRRPNLDFRVPECQILRTTTAIRAIIREGQLHKIEQLMEIGAQDGQWSWERYRRWLGGRGSFVRPRIQPPPPAFEEPPPLAPTQRAPDMGSLSSSSPRGAQSDGVVDLDGGAGGSLEDLIAQIERRK